MIIIQRRLMLDRLPHMVNLLHRILAQRPVLQPLERLLQLVVGAGAHDDRVAVLVAQRRVVRHPAVGEVGLGAALLFGDRVPLRERGQVGRALVHLVVDCCVACVS